MARITPITGTTTTATIWEVFRVTARLGTATAVAVVVCCGDVDTTGPTVLAGGSEDSGAVVTIGPPMRINCQRSSRKSASMPLSLLVEASEVGTVGRIVMKDCVFATELELRNTGSGSSRVNVGDGDGAPGVNRSNVVVMVGEELVDGVLSGNVLEVVEVEVVGASPRTAGRVKDGSSFRSVSTQSVSPLASCVQVLFSGQQKPFPQSFGAMKGQFSLCLSTTFRPVGSSCALGVIAMSSWPPCVDLLGPKHQAWPRKRMRKIPSIYDEPGTIAMKTRSRGHIRYRLGAAMCC